MDRITFRGHVGRHEVLTTLDEADVLLLPTQHDEAPLIVAEALARGVRPVVLARGGPAVFVGDAGVAVGVSGPAKLPRELAEAVQHASRIDPSAAIQRARDVFLWSSKDEIINWSYETAVEEYAQGRQEVSVLRGTDLAQP
jgi:glycosyltransferase involved in cell wall biosynthesis